MFLLSLRVRLSELILWIYDVSALGFYALSRMWIQLSCFVCRLFRRIDPIGGYERSPKDETKLVEGEFNFVACLTFYR